MMGEKEYGFNVFEDVLKNKKILVYSFGIGENLSFSEDIIQHYNAEIYAYDPTPKSIEYVAKHVISTNKNFHFKPFGLSDKNEIATFYLPQNEEWVSGSSIITEGKKETGIDVEMRDINTLMRENGHTYLDILKMDIEGSEFRVIEGLIQSGAIPNIYQICVEVHDRFLSNGIKELFKFVNGLERYGYKMISVSDSYEELTFIKKGIL